MASCRFAFAVHILAVLAYKRGEDVTSDLLAGSVNTNAVVIRRILCDLRHAGIVVTQLGAGGGARLARQPEQITLREVYDAVERRASFSLHRQPPDPRCPVGGRIEEVLRGIFSTAQEALERELAEHSVAELLESVMETPDTQR
jgi:Rrf2 family protein